MAVKTIISDINVLRKPCVDVLPDEDVTQIITDLKDTLKSKGMDGVGLSANQIGYNKCVSYIRIVDEVNTKTKEVKLIEHVLINPRIIEKASKLVVKNEGCLSFPGLHIDTDRWVFITLEYLDENKQARTEMFQDYTAIVMQHEVSHLRGRTILDCKHRSR